MRALKRTMAVALAAGALGVVSPAPAFAQDPICLPYRNGLTITLVGQDIDVPGHGIGCTYPPTVEPPTVYQDGNTTVVSFNPYGDRICMFGINGNCRVAVEI